jgi:hypothetical protein
MYDFAIIILMGLAIFKVVDLLEDFVPGLAKFHLLTTLVLGVVAAMWLDYSVFARYGVEISNSDLGTVMTGLAMGGTTSIWRAAFHWLGTSEGEEPEVRHQHRPRIAA